MAKTVEFEAKTSQEALDLAVQETGIPLSDLKFEIVSPGGGGIFGLSMRKSKVRVFLPGTEEDEKEAETASPDQPAAPAAPEVQTPAAPEVEAPAIKRASEPPQSTWARPSRAVDAPDQNVKKVTIEDVMGPPRVPDGRIDLDLRPEGAQGPARDSQPRRSRGSSEKRSRGGRSKEPRRGSRDRSPKRNAEAGAKPKIRELKDLENGLETEPVEQNSEHLAYAMEAVKAILEPWLPDTKVEADWRADKIYINVLGDGSGLLIGRKGQTLDALQYLVGKIVDRQVGQHIRLMVDTESYRERRDKSLIVSAQELAEQALQTGRPARTGPLNPHERRIVHLALQDEERLKTRSQGEGIFKRVVIAPN